MLGRLYEGNDSCGRWPANSTTISKGLTVGRISPRAAVSERSTIQISSNGSGITGSLPMTSQQLELIARRGLTLPEPTLTRLRTVGIWCEANLRSEERRGGEECRS